MSERKEVRAGNPGVTHMLEELVKARRQLREYEGMMTRREVLERLAMAWSPQAPCDFLERTWHGDPWVCNVTAGLVILGLARNRDDLPDALLLAIHELALLINTQRQ